ncbi:Ig-like domain-containing protein [Lutibacter oricola]|uniref:Ig-like domain-containing protein n=1 Tax=Lutibacter oricola TaxID=762486 RepID=A0A1H3G5P8_9FLAO|nr:Ig-like domain-containing protein [Lutibacter oricola]SDX98653.1 Ig-like domain-containing protein [Lutibacter oricola]
MKYFKFFLLIAISSTLVNCARRGSPTGGLKDSIPPSLIKATPPLETTNFKAKKIKILFDEYVKLEDVKKNLVISPPQKNEPLIIPVGTASKFISISIQDTLAPNTTYSFNFGNSIVDNNEGNELGNFKYVFSTGTFIDSLYVSGEVTDPLIKESAKEIDVLLYEYNEKFTDSIIYKEKPSYVANTLDSTLYNLTNIKEGKYLLIALKDVNGNKIYNPRTDKIGFVKDTITLPTDSIYNFTLFKEVPELRVIKPKEANKGHLIFGYEGNAENLNIKLLTETPENFKSQIIFDKEKDTVHFWYSPFKTDSLNFEISKGTYLDYLTARTRTKKIDSLKINNSQSTLHLIDTFALNSNTPIVEFNKAYISLKNQKDSSVVKYNAFLSKDKLKLYLGFEKEYESRYKLELLPEAIRDIYGVSTDSLEYDFSTKNIEDYSTLNLTFTGNYSKGLIIELLNSKEETIRITKSDKPKKISFKLLKPDTYFVKITLDKNNNGVWDTGIFLDKILPEKVIYLNKPLKLRANWELDETFLLH